jgi:DNA repair exonuclease SbcCD ATPase subunit
MTSEDYLQQYGELKRLQGLMSQTHEMLNNAHDVLAQLEALKARMEKADASDEKEIVNALEAAWKEMETLQNEWTRPPPHMNYRQKPRMREEIRSLAYAIDGATAKPTTSQKNRAVELKEEVKVAAEEFEKVLREEIAALNSLVKDMPSVGIKKRKP